MKGNLRRAISWIISLAMLVTLFAGLGVFGVTAEGNEVSLSGGTVVPAGNTVYDFTQLTEKTLAPGTDGFDGFSGTVSTAASSTKSYVQLSKGKGDSLTFQVEGTWSATFSSTHSNNSKGILITAPDGKLYGRKDSALTLTDMAPGTYTITEVSAAVDADDGTGATVSLGANHAYISEIVFDVQSTEPPADVTNLKAVAGDSQVNLSWDAEQTASSYNIYINDSAVPINVEDNYYLATELTNDTLYTFMVKAVNSVGESAGVQVSATPKEPTDPPGAFTLDATAKDQAVELVWTAALYAVTYDVYRDGVKIAENLKVRTYLDSNLNNGTEYTYYVAAVNKNGVTNSNEDKSTPQEPEPSDITIISEKGWLESAYIEWTNPVEVDGYNVYYKKNGESTYTKADDELIRYYDSYYRADVVGLAEGEYKLAVTATERGAESTLVESSTLTVMPHNRDGYAFDKNSPNGTSSGGYNDDGTVPANAQIVYIDKNNANTVQLEVVLDSKGNTTVANGIAEIMAAREKGYDKTPLIVRFIGHIPSSSVSGINSSGYIQIKGCYNVTFEGIGNDTMFTAWGLLVRAVNNVEVRNIGLYGFPDDGISLDTNNRNVWVHNNDYFYGKNQGGDKEKGDGSCDIKSDSSYVTIAYNHFWDSGKCSLCGMTGDKIEYFATYHHNWFDHSDSRHPRVRRGTVHVYNNYFDGNAKYGIGATNGSSVFVENNVFRNCKNPVLISRQGTESANGNETLSNENGGIIKMYNNSITGSNTVRIIDWSEDNVQFDAYIAGARDELVPDSVITYQGGTAYNNFDTASGFYSYMLHEPSQVVDDVKAYSGRVEGSDFYFLFDNEVDDVLYSINKELSNALVNYKTTLVQSYTSGGTYPATSGDTPTPKPTAPPEPTVDPTKPTAEPTAKPVFWKAEADIKVGEEFGIKGLSTLADMIYSVRNQTISGVAFGGKCVVPADGTAASDDGKSGASLKFIPETDGTFTVYYKINAGKTFNVFDEAGNAIVSDENTTGASEYTSTSVSLTAGNAYYACVPGSKAEFFGAAFSTAGGGEDPDPTNPPATEPPATEPPTSEPPATIPPATANPYDFDYQFVSADFGEQDKLEVVLEAGSPTMTAKLIVAGYGANDVLIDIKMFDVIGDQIQDLDYTKPADASSVAAYIWNDTDGIKPLSVSKNISITAAATPIPTIDPESLVSQDTSKTWTFSTTTMSNIGIWETVNDKQVFNIVEPKTFENLFINANEDKKISIDNSNKTFDGVSYTERIKLGGSGSTAERCLAFKPGKSGTVTVHFTHASSSGDPRVLIVNQDGVLTKQSVEAKGQASITADVIAGMPVCIYSENSGLNLFAIIYTAD